MSYQIVEDHDDGVTLKDIADAEGINFVRGLGFYELTKKEKVSAGKKLVLWGNGAVVSDDSTEVLKRLGLKPNADNNIQPSHIPAGHKLFVQSTSPNRKITEDSSALFLLADDVPVKGKGSKRKADNDGDDDHDDDDDHEDNEEGGNDEEGNDKKKQKVEGTQIGSYKIVEDHDDGVTLKDIADAEGINFVRGLGFYELIKKEKVSAGKKLVLWGNGAVVSDDSTEVLKRLGLKPNADNNIQPSHIPAGHKLFVQSTSPSRKISEDAAVLFMAINSTENINIQELVERIKSQFLSLPGSTIDPPPSSLSPTVPPEFIELLNLGDNWVTCDGAFNIFSPKDSQYTVEILGDEDLVEEWKEEHTGANCCDGSHQCIGFYGDYDYFFLNINPSSPNYGATRLVVNNCDDDVPFTPAPFTNFLKVIDLWTKKVAEDEDLVPHVFADEIRSSQGGKPSNHVDEDDGGDY